MSVSEPQFIHLGVHSEYSLVDGLVRIDELVERSAELGMPAVALTDVCNFFALVKFYEAAQRRGLKPICGAEFTLTDANGGAPARLTLLVQNDIGYRNLTRLMSRAYLEGQVQGRPTVRRDWVTAASEGLIMLSGGRFGDVGQALLSRREDAATLLQGWLKAFPERYYLELHRTGRPDEDEYLHRAVALAAAHDCPVVATNDVRFLAPDQFDAHEVRVCINESRTLNDPRRERRYSDRQYLRSPAEMAELFDDLPEALANSVEIARRCNLELRLDQVRLPEYPVPAGLSAAEFFHRVATEGLERRLAVLLDPAQPDYEAQRTRYSARLEFEIGIIEQMGFAGYFLIVMDFIRWAKANDIPVGPGRGSGAGSLVAYALEITDLDPLAYDLLFERFLNPERVSMPDFDIDFCMDNRDRVIAYVADRYGREAVSQIITFGTMAAKAVVRDVARVQGKSYGLADKLSKMIPNELGITLEKAREQEEVLRDFLAGDDEAQEIWDMALQLEGLTRNAGKHAGGVVIAPGAITDFAPLYCDAAGEGLVTQFDKDDVERVGLVKFDFLGLRTLTIIDWAVRNANRERERAGEAPLAIAAIPLDDAATYVLLQKAHTTAVFQLESRGIRELILRLKPSRFEDIVALVALFRPGPLQSGMVHDFIDRKHGRQPVAYPHPKYQHPALKPVLEPTYGIILYQEQVMQIAQVLGGYSLGEADLLRRAMGKKKAEEMAEQRAIFRAGAIANGIAAELAENIFDLMEKFAGYGFNKSHSAAYALLAYQTAWLKAHHPAAFMAAVLSADMQNTDKVVTLIDECRALALKVAPPDVNAGLYQFSVAADGGVIYGLGAIKGLGQGPVDAIIAARESGGPFLDLFDFCARVDSRRLNKRALDALIRAGAMDTLGPEQDAFGAAADIGYRRAVLCAATDEAVRLADQQARNLDAGIGDLFGGAPAQRATRRGYASYAAVPGFGVAERLRGEKETLGLYLTGHPLDEYVDELERLVPLRIAALRAARETQRLVGLVVGTRTMKTRRGDTMCFITLDDRSGRIEVAVFAELYREHREKLVRDAILVVDGQVSEDDYSGGIKMRADTVHTLAEARRSALKSLVLELRGDRVGAEGAVLLADILAPYRRGGCPLRLRYRRAGAMGEIALPPDWALNPEDELLHRLRDNFGRDSLQLNY
ncbi:MAG: DNA polymerase III subunit alpha [Gammaproteobacteria bacterium]|nr:DNA polymerase III subunit alpha [Gammaproteobacteria bacterium]